MLCEDPLENVFCGQFCTQFCGGVRENSIVLCPESPELVGCESGGEEVLLGECDVLAGYGSEETSVRFVEIRWIYAIVQ